MRIGIITGEYPPMQGGVGAYTYILANELAQQGHDVHLFSTREARSDDLPLENTIMRWNRSSLSAIKHWAKANKLDITNLQFQTAAYQMSPWVHFLPDYLRDVPFVTTFHDLRFPYLFPKAGPLRHWIVMHLASASTGAIVTNHEDAATLSHLPHTCLIPIGSNINASLSDDYNRDHWRQRIGAKSDDFVLAFFGMLNRSKGVDTLLKSVARLRDEGLPVRLLMIGARMGSSDPTNQAYAAEMDHLIAQSNLSDHLHWTGFVEETDVTAYLKCADVVVLPFVDGASFRRGSLMAAIQAGCPIVTTIPRVHVKEFVHGENMLLVPPSNSQALAAMLRQFYEDSSGLDQKLMHGARELSRHFDWHQIATDYTNFFQTLL
ncbi:MAG: glycosyltransferase family 4 protein [Anaerolineae bacterium]|nr:glycosyltransferase family 4 protein [Anaerolineae bacterium]